MIATCDPEVLANLQHCDVVFKLPDHSLFFIEGVPGNCITNPQVQGLLNIHLISERPF